MASPLDPSREATPSSTSSQGMSNDFPSSHSASGSSQGQGQGHAQGQGAQAGEDVDRFLKRMDMEKKLQALQQRLELASMKATNGWTDMSLGEIEDKLPTPPPRRRSSVHPIPGINLESAAAAAGSVASSSRTPYEPPSPSRPWQLMDVLWQPLPPPSRGPMSPVSPVSPSVQRRRSKREDLMVDVHGHHHLGGASVHGSNGQRRASSAAMMAFLGRDPYPVQSGGRARKEKRSQSHSAHTTTQDVDAAKALTAMLGGGGGGGGGSPRAGTPLQGSPFSPGTPPPRHRSASVQRRTPSTAPPRSHAQRRANSDDSMDVDLAQVSEGGPSGNGTETKRGEEDTDAAELMMFLAHSPSAAGARRYSPSLSEASIGKTARVLFADGPVHSHHPTPEPSKPMGSSNLALAPPITAGSLMRGVDEP